MSNRLQQIAKRRSGQQSTPESPAASTGPADPSETHRRLRENFEGLLAGASPDALGNMGLVVKQVLPMLMRRFHALPEDRLRAGLADMVQRLQTILGDQPVTGGADVSRETSGVALLAAESARTDDDEPDASDDCAGPCCERPTDDAGDA